MASLEKHPVVLPFLIAGFGLPHLSLELPTYIVPSGRTQTPASFYTLQYFAQHEKPINVKINHTANTMQRPTRTALSFSSIAPRSSMKYAAYDIMTTPQNIKLRTAICVTSKNATIYGPTSGYTNGLINATHKEVPINPGASPLPMMTSPMNVATISVNACIASGFNQ